MLLLRGVDVEESALVVSLRVPLIRVTIRVRVRVVVVSL